MSPASPPKSPKSPKSSSFLEPASGAPLPGKPAANLLSKCWKDACVWLLVAAVALGLYGYIRLGAQAGQHLQYVWNWQRASQFFLFYDSEGAARAGPLLIGLVSTLRLAFYSIVVGLAIGVPAGILQVQGLRLLRLLGQLYVELIRNIPPLVVVTVFYFFFASPLIDWLGLETLSRQASPQLRSLLRLFLDLGQGQNNLILGNFVAAAIILGIYEGAYIAEIVRAGLQAIPQGQQRAALALGLSQQQNYLLVLLPQMFRSQLPALTNQFVSAIKDSAIVSLISIQELTFRSKQVITTTQAFVESAIILFLLYLLLTGLCSLLAARLSERYRLR